MAENSWKVSPAEAGTRLDVLVARRMGLSRAQCREALRRGWVEVDGLTVGESQKGRLLESGTAVRISEDLVELFEVAANPDLALTVLAEGDGWIAVDKPAGMAVHPLRSDQRDTALNKVLALHPQIQGVGEGGLRSGVVHRLDVDTSGVQLFALDDPGFQRLRSAFRNHRIEKVYWALVHGQPPERGEARQELRIRQHRPARVVVVETPTSDSRSCTTSWTVLERGEDHAFVELRPSTGFLHQIRVCMAHLGHPLVGDSVYGRPDGAPRHMLHARAISLAEIVAQSLEPADFAGERAARIGPSD